VYLEYGFRSSALNTLDTMPPGNQEANQSSIVNILQHGDAVARAKALEHVIIAHWKPLYKYLRAQYRFSHTEAWTFTVNFLALFQERTFFAGYDGRGMPLREFIRGKLDVFVPTPAARRAVAPAPEFDFRGADEEFLADQLSPDQSGAEYYNNEWVRTILTLAVEELYGKLAAEGKSRDFELFMKLDLQDRSGDQRVSIESVAEGLSMPMAEAWNSLAKTRQRFQDTLVDLIRSFTSSDAEFRRESRAFTRS
jgi:hypothetical protein